MLLFSLGYLTGGFPDPAKLFLLRFQFLLHGSLFLFFLFLVEIIITPVKGDPPTDNSAMEANRFNKVRSWLTTNKVIRQDVMKSYNFSRLRLSRWLVGSSNSRIEGWWISIPERKTLVFSPPLNVRIGWERRICSKPQACRAARLRSSIVQSSASVLKLERRRRPR